MLANLCVVQMYESSARACERYKALQGVSSNPGWPTDLPRIYYDTSLSNSVQMRGSFDTGATAPDVAFLRFILATYNVNGVFLGLHDLTSQFQLCLQVRMGWGFCITLAAALLFFFFFFFFFFFL